MTRFGQRRTGAPGPRETGRSAFTLIETLLALAVVALLAGMLLPGIAGIFRTIDNDAPDQILWDAVTAAREQALTENRLVRLSFDKEKHLLSWGNETRTVAKAWPAGVTLDFLQPKQGGLTVLIGGRLVETETIPVVRFYPDGTCDRFRAQLRAGTAAARVIAIDPWTCAQLLAPEANK